MAQNLVHAQTVATRLLSHLQVCLGMKLCNITVAMGDAIGVDTQSEFMQACSAAPTQTWCAPSFLHLASVPVCMLGCYVSVEPYISLQYLPLQAINNTTLGKEQSNIAKDLTTSRNRLQK